MSGGPDLFVVCKNCNSEVSPYITECPYCGQRLRKRAPKLDAGRPRRSRRPRALRASLGRLRPGEIPGIRGEHIGMPYATISLVAASLFMWIALVFVARNDVAILHAVGTRTWLIATAPFTYFNGWYQAAALVGIGLYGWLLERRHGPLLVLALFIAAGCGGVAVDAAVDPTPLAAGGNGAALGLLFAWAVPDLLARSRGEEYEGDLLGTAVIALVLLLMPIARPEASAIAGFTGAVLGLLAGLALARPRVRPR